MLDSSMKLLSVNTSEAKPISDGKKSGSTGIFKMPRLGPVQIGFFGLEGDVQVDTENHGGKDQAVYIYSMDDYHWFSEQLGTLLEPGTFGENLTLSNLPEPLYIGDRFEVGSVILEVTGPRIPCSTLAARMNDKEFVKTFSKANRPGIYARVIQEGVIQAGNPVKYHRSKFEMTILEEFQFFYQKYKSIEELERFLAVPISERSRRDYEKMLGE
jgi:MOSC domain-containing protein YiiM